MQGISERKMPRMSRQCQGDLVQGKKLLRGEQLRIVR
jgi:hypothetical protein